MKRDSTEGLRDKHSFEFVRLALRNFRGFRSLREVNLAPITFIVGQNSSGKSSLLDAMLFFAQSNAYLSRSIALAPTWTGRLVDLGSYKDTVYRHVTELPITVTVGVRVVENYRPFEDRNPPSERIDINVSSTFVAKANDSIGRLKRITLADPKTAASLSLTLASGRNVRAKLKIADSSETWESPSRDTRHINSWIQRQFYKLLRLSSVESRRGKSSGFRLLKRAISSSFFVDMFLERVQRVKSGRDAPQRWYPISAPVPRFRGALTGTAVGAVTPADVEVTMNKSTRNEAYDPLNRLSKQSQGKGRVRIARALRKMNIARRITSKTLSPYHKAVHISDNKTGVDANLIDVGFGASQVLPVLFEASRDDPAPLFVEQPEIHLHPQAQGEVAEFLLDTARVRQIFIETHSVHLINRARIRILKGELLPADVKILYVQKGRDGSDVLEIDIDEKGEFTNAWPNGFFDERYEDTLKILSLKGEK